jgi:fatty acid-binding protein DegV
MIKFIITTDSSCDCAIDELKNKNIPVAFFKYSDEAFTFEDTMNEKSYKNFYRQIKILKTT